MAETIFLDTNIMLDYIENRHQEVRDIIAQLLLFHRKNIIILSTSIFNLAELIDKEFEIHFIGSLLSQKLSYDEIYRKKYRDIRSYREFIERNKDIIKKRIDRFIFENNINILSLNLDEEEFMSYKEIYELIYKYQLSSQDAFIVATALRNNIKYFLSNDDDLVNMLNNNGLIDAFNLRKESHRKNFKNYVIDNLMEVLQ